MVVVLVVVGRALNNFRKTNVFIYDSGICTEEKGGTSSKKAFFKETPKDVLFRRGITFEKKNDKSLAKTRECLLAQIFNRNAEYESTC